MDRGSARATPRSAPASPRTGSPSSRGELGDVLAVVAVLGRLLAAPHRLDRRAEAVHLRARVVVVVLALDLVPRELEQARDRVAVGAVPCRRDGDRAGRVRRHHLDLDALLRRRPSRRRTPSPASRIAASASTNHASARNRLTKPGPAISARSTPAARCAASASSAASSRGGLPPRAGELQRGVRRVVAVLGVARPLERRPPAPSARRELALTGSAGNGSRWAKRSSRRCSSSVRADADEHVARLDAHVGLRRRVERAVALAQRDR